MPFSLNIDVCLFVCVEHYSFGQKGVVPEFQKAAWPALDALDNRPDWDWSVFDIDKDGKLDSVVITHSGYGTYCSDYSHNAALRVVVYLLYWMACALLHFYSGMLTIDYSIGAETTTTDEYGRDYNNRIWAHAFAEANFDSTWVSKDGSISLFGYTVASAFENDKGVVPATIGLTVHEYMHTFALIDLYDTTNPAEGSGIGGFDIMANPYGPSGNANFPGHLSSWSKLQAEWVTPTDITEDGIYTLRPLETSPDGYKILLGDTGETVGAKQEYLLLVGTSPSSGCSQVPLIVPYSTYIPVTLHRKIVRN